MENNICHHFSKWIFSLFQRLSDNGEMSSKMVKSVMFLNLIQYISLNLDKNLWKTDIFFQTDLLSACNILLKPFQITPFLYIPAFQAYCFGFWCGLINVITLLLFVQIYVFTEGFIIQVIRFYHVIFPLIIIPFLRAIFSPFYNNNMNGTLYYVLSIESLIFFIIQALINLYVFNENMFNSNNRMNRIIYKIDVLYYIAQSTPLVFGLLINYNFSIYMSLITQLICFMLLLYHIDSNVTYFDLKISLFYSKILFFKLLFIILLIFGVAIEKTQSNNQIFLIINVSFAIFLSQTIIDMRFKSFIFIPKKKSILSDQNQNFKPNIMRLFMIFSYFYYEPIDYKVYKKFLKEIPLELLSLISREKNKTLQEKNDNIEALTYNQIEAYEENIIKHVIELCEQLKIIRMNEVDMFPIIMPLLLAKKKIFQAVRLIDKIQRKKDLFTFLDEMNFLLFLEKIQKAFLGFENELTTKIDENSLIIKTTNFKPQRFYDFDRNYDRLLKNIDKYYKELIHFLENIKSENPNIALLEKKGVVLLALQKKIDEIFLIGEENPVYLYTYFQYLQTYKPDHKKDIVKYIKKFNALKLLERMTLRENNHIYEFIVENLTFSTNSSFLFVSGSQESLGRIVKVDSKLMRLLNYKEKMELMGNNINILIPNIIAENHQNYLENYLKTGINVFTFKEQNVYLKKKDGELINFLLTIKPHLMETNHKLIFFCHLKSNFDKIINSVMVVDKFGFIDSYGGNITELINPLFTLYGRKFYLQMFIPTLSDYFMKVLESEENEMKQYEDTEDFDIHFLLLLEKYEHLCERFHTLDKEKIKEFFEKIKENVQEIDCGVKKFRVEFELKLQKTKNFSYFLLCITNLSFLNFRTQDERKKTRQTARKGETFLTLIPRYAIKVKSKVEENSLKHIKQENLLKRKSLFILPNVEQPIRRTKSEPFIRNPYLLNKTKNGTNRSRKKKKEEQEHEKEKFYDENKRFIFVNSSHEDDEKHEIMSHPSVSSVQSTVSKDLKENFFKLIKIDSVPVCYVRYVYFHVILFVLGMMSLIFLSVIISSTITQISVGFNQTFLIENFKIRFLKTLFYAHKYKKFNSTFELGKINDQGNKMAIDIFQLLNPPFNNINNVNLMFSLPNRSVIISSIDAINFFDSFSIDSNKHPYKVDLIIANGLHIFQLLEGIANILEILLDLVNSVEKNLIVYAAIVSSIASVIVLFQIFNLTLCYSYINDNFKKILTIPNEEIDHFLESIQESRLEKNEFKMNKSKTTFTTLTLKNNPKFHLKTFHKKKHPIELIKFPVLKSFLLAIASLSVFCCFVIIILYKSSFLDQSIVTFFKGEAAFQRSKAYNYMYIIRRVNKLYLNNSYGYDDKETKDMFNDVREGVNILLSHANDFNGQDRVNYLAAINENLCTAVLSTYPLAANLTQCPKLASGQYTKGMVGALSYANLLFEQDIAGAFNLNVQSNIDLLDYSVILYDRKLRIVAQTTLDLISRNLNQQNTDSLNLNIVFLIITSLFLLGYYLFFLKRYLKKRLMNSKLVFQLIPSKILFKSGAIKTYLRKLLSERMKKN